MIGPPESRQPHSHRPSLAMLGLAFGYVILATALLVIALYLNDRRAVADRRNEMQRQGMCAVLQVVSSRQVPLQDPFVKAVDKAVAAFRCGPTHPSPTPTP